MGKIGDLWVRLGLKKDGFDKGMDSVKKKGVDALKGVAGAAGVAMGAMEVFNRVVTANESNNDKWENTVRAMNNAVNEFFSALTSGDFSGFQDGLEGIARKARETAEALRQIEDAQTVYGLFSTENRAIFNENMVTLRNKNASKEEIDAAKKAVEDVMAKQTEESEVLADKALNAVQNIIAQRGNINAADITEADVKNMLSIALDRQGGLKDDDLAQRYKEYEEAYKNLRARYSEIDYTTGRVMFVGGDEYRKELASLNNEYADANLYNAIWNKVNGDELKQLVSFLQSAYAARTEIASMQRSYQRVDQSTTNLGGSGTEPPPPEGSLAYLQQELKKAQDAAATAVGEEAQKQAMETVRKIEAEIEEMKNRITASLRDPWEAIPDLPAIPLPDKLESTSGLGLALPETDGADMDEFSFSTLEAADAVGVLAGAMSNLTGLVDSGAASWLSYGANVLQTVAQAIPAITSLTAAKNANAAANVKDMAAGAGSSVASIPIVGPVMAVAAIASVIAALANIPKFAEGGVVGGSSYYGDRILARLNSGELVLNQGQQAVISDMLDRPVQRVEITGRMTASGRDLQYIFDKYNTYRKQ